jgi:hypothetical protein
MDARSYEDQSEVRSFTTDVLTGPVEWTGRIRADLFLTSTAQDTDLIVRVCDVYPDGRSILLVEYAIVARRGQPAHGDQPAVAPMSRWDALLDACHKRARPIVMTTIAMAAGMMPIALGWGSADVSFRSPMAIAVIGGLLTSTFLSLLVIPVVFTYLDDIGQWSVRLWRRLRGGTPAAAGSAP